MNKATLASLNALVDGLEHEGDWCLRLTRPSDILKPGGAGNVEERRNQ